MNLIEILEKTVSPNKIELETALHYLEQAQQHNLPAFLKELSDVLKHGGNSSVARMQAGIQLKNVLYSKDATTHRTYAQRWLTFPDDLRTYIKQNVLATLGSEEMRPSSAAQCVAYIACTELPFSLWPDLMGILCNNVIKADSSEMLKESSLEAIGYICQEIEPQHLQSLSNEILTAIVCGMKKEEPSNKIRLAATNALYNSLEFTKANFEVENERHYIMQVVCEATQSGDVQVKVVALQCLVKIMSLYYQHMEHYMGPALFAITLEATKSPIEQISLQGIEFWSTVCDEEVDLAIEAAEAQEQGRPPERKCHYYARGALQYLVAILTQTLTKQEEYGGDDDDWNPCKAAGVCLMLLATCCEDAIVPHVLPFVTQNIKNPDWKHRDAAIMAFGSILEGPRLETLKPIVEQAMPTIIELFNDPSIAIRDTAAWTVGRICEIIPEAVMNENYMKHLLFAMVEGLKAEPRVAANVCWAFSSLVEAAYDNVERESGVVETFSLSFCFEGIILKLLETTNREDANKYNLRGAAYEALMEMVKNSPKDCYPTVKNLTMSILERLQHVLQMENQVQLSSDRSQLNDLESLLCAALQSVLRKMTKEDASQISDIVMGALLHMLATPKGSGVQEDALTTVSTLVEVLGEGFLKYMEAFKPCFLAGLNNYEDTQVCQAAVGMVGDLCRALVKKFLPYCDEVMFILLRSIDNDEVNKDIKPTILSAFGDIALAINSDFRKYLQLVLNLLCQASQTKVDKNDYDMLDYLNKLRESCLEAYTGIIQGLKDEQGVNQEAMLELQGVVQNIVAFLNLIATDPDSSDDVIGTSCGLVGDLCSTFGVSVLKLVDTDVIKGLLAKGKKLKASKYKTLATWAAKQIRTMKNEC